MERQRLEKERTGFVPFEKGVSGNPNGRPKGAKTKIPKLVKDAIIDAGHAAGMIKLDEAVAQARAAWRRATKEPTPNPKKIARLKETYEALRRYRYAGPDGLTEYITWCAITYPKSYLNLLGRVMPTQVLAKIDHSGDIYSSKDELLERLKESGVPVHQINN